MANERSVDFRAKAIAARSPVMLEQLRHVAQSLLTARRALRMVMPVEFVHTPPIDLLFTLFVAEEHIMAVPALVAATPVAPQVAQRWIQVLAERDLVTLRGGAIVLSETGFQMMAEACQALIEAQTKAQPTSLN